MDQPPTGRPGKKQAPPRSGEGPLPNAPPQPRLKTNTIEATERPERSERTKLDPFSQKGHRGGAFFFADDLVLPILSSLRTKTLRSLMQHTLKCVTTQAELHRLLPTPVSRNLQNLTSHSSNTIELIPTRS